MKREESALLIVDVQEKLAPSIPGIDGIVATITATVKGAIKLGIPFLFTEQYSKGLGKTVTNLRQLKSPAAMIEKTSFCATSEPQNLERLRSLGRRQFIVAGTEAHVCVLQTVFGLLQNGFEVYVVGNAIGSCSPLDRTVAIERMRSAGAVPVTAEMVLFEWLERADTDEFRELLPIIKGLVGGSSPTSSVRASQLGPGGSVP